MSNGHEVGCLWLLLRKAKRNCYKNVLLYKNELQCMFSKHFSDVSQMAMHDVSTISKVCLIYGQKSFNVVFMIFFMMFSIMCPKCHKDIIRCFIAWEWIGLTHFWNVLVGFKKVHPWCFKILFRYRTSWQKYFYEIFIDIITNVMLILSKRFQWFLRMLYLFVTFRKCHCHVSKTL